VDERDPAAGGRDLAHTASGCDAPARAGEIGGERARDQREVDDAGRRRVQRGDPAGVGLDLAQLVGFNSAKARNPVGDPAALELVEARKLIRLGGDDHLARALGADPPLVAVLV
jgi:hypothetical protein